MQQTQRVVITGGPGTGKTTLLRLLNEKGYPCHSEISRNVIREQLECGSDLLPWKDVAGFSKLVSDGQVKQYHEAIEGLWNFYDRGVPDVLAYLRKANIYEEELEERPLQYPYFKTVFLTPPWPEIYSQDAERRENLTEMLSIHEALYDVYHDFGYRVLEVPKISIHKRLDFILENLYLK